MTELVTSSLSGRYGLGTPIDSVFEISWKVNRVVDSVLNLPITIGTPLGSSFEIGYEAGRFKTIFNLTKASWDEYEEFNTSTKGLKLGTHPLGDSHGFNYDFLEKFNSTFNGAKAGTHSVDTDGAYSFQMVDVQGSKLNPDREFRYLPTSDFSIGSELVSFTTDFIEPIDLSTIKTRLSPVDSGTEFPWSRTTVVDIYKELTYGYSINNF